MKITALLLLSALAGCRSFFCESTTTSSSAIEPSGAFMLEAGDVAVEVTAPLANLVGDGRVGDTPVALVLAVGHAPYTFDGTAVRRALEALDTNLFHDGAFDPLVGQSWTLSSADGSVVISVEPPMQKSSLTLQLDVVVRAGSARGLQTFQAVPHSDTNEICHD